MEKFRSFEDPATGIMPFMPHKVAYSCCFLPSRGRSSEEHINVASEGVGRAGSGAPAASVRSGGVPMLCARRDLVQVQTKIECKRPQSSHSMYSRAACAASFQSLASDDSASDLTTQSPAAFSSSALGLSPAHLLTIHKVAAAPRAHSRICRCPSEQLLVDLGGVCQEEQRHRVSRRTEGRC
eukprot:1409039-Rhodomonas_salina.1